MTGTQPRPPSDPSCSAGQKPVPVLLVIDSLDGGGAERYVVDLAIALHGRGWPVEVACSTGGVRAETLTAAGVPVHTLMPSLVKRRASARYGLALRRLLRHHRPALVHAHLYASAAAAVQATRGLSIALVVTEHTEAPWRGRTARAISRVVYQRADHIIAVSSTIHTLLTDRYNVPHDRVEVLLPATTWTPRPVARARHAVARGTTLVGAVGRLVPEKGIDVFLQAASLVSAVVPQVRFVIVGEGPLQGDLQNQAATLGISDIVTFAGFRADAPEIIAGLDVLTVPSRSDGSPLVVCEAMAGGIPVIASRVGGLPDLVQDNRSGLLVRPGDPEELARALVSVLIDPAVAHHMGTRAQNLATTRTHAQMVDRMAELYSSLAGTRVSTGNEV